MDEADLHGSVLLPFAADGAAGLLSIVGGKLASYRAQSEEASDRIEDLLGRPRTRCRTQDVPLPGGDEVPDPSTPPPSERRDSRLAS